MSSITSLSVVLMILLLPVQFLSLPLNLAPFDVAAAVGLPACWMWLVGRDAPLRLPLLSAMLLILLATGLASLTSPIPFRGGLVITREIYLYLMLVTLAAVFEQSSSRDLRRFLMAWCVAAGINGALILAQLFVPTINATMNSMLGGMMTVDTWRPSGLFKNSNAAAAFQMLGLLPVVLLRWSYRDTVVAGTLVFATVVATGSMGATLALTCGLIVGIGMLAIVFQRWRSVITLAVGATLALGVLVGVLVVLMEFLPELGDRVESLSLARSDRSARSRMNIWSSVWDAMMGEMPLFGTGPDFRATGAEVHNDLLSFTLERGLMGTLGLLLFAVTAVSRAITAARAGIAIGEPWGIVFPAAVAAVMVEAQTHEVFHFREVWLALALQEAVIWRCRKRAIDMQGRPASLESTHPKRLPDV